MILYIKGTLAVVSESKVIIEAGAFSIAVKIFRAVIERLLVKGAELLSRTYLKTSEDTVSLCGFDKGADLRLFRAPLDASDIGSKRVLVVLSALEPGTLKLAALTGDVEIIAKAPGIGVRIAEWITLELKSRGVMRTLPTDTVSGGSVSDAATMEVIDALVQLSYGIGGMTHMIRTVLEVEKKDSETLLQGALRQFQA